MEMGKVLNVVLSGTSLKHLLDGAQVLLNISKQVVRWKDLASTRRKFLAAFRECVSFSDRLRMASTTETSVYLSEASRFSARKPSAPKP